ncbi:hypothetical protein THAR02_00192 [Trichoderma harzianum]|uniref:Life-span regulatory factor domain-containing protein n=1 Tax=Trichoderma harzianum TaxID=5544 RepID=A0A0F9XSH5_TRIHA|nr:hypothetical protein THAR02_00192 [Trichoderma harzianum]
MPHHQRRKSGPYSANSSTTDVRKAVTATPTQYKRPAMTRRHTPSSAQKLGRGNREHNSEVWDNDERESFPQYCMTCEKQFVPYDEMFLYCSDACRRVDQTSSSSQQAATVHSYYGAVHNSYAHYPGDKSEPRDIVPRASPSRPSSMHFSNSPPASPGTTLNYHTSAMSALRSLNVRPPSPPSPTGSGIWPFSRSSATSPNNSYTRPSTSGFFSSASTYDLGYGGAYSHDTASGAMDRPLPSRNPGSSSRPKSIELVIPMLSR